MVRGRALIVEDEGLVAESLHEALQDLGVAVTGIAASGEEALRMAERDAPDVVLMDIKLRGTPDGIETARRIRMRSPVPVIYISGNLDARTKMRSQSTHPVGYLTKPVNEEELNLLLQRVLPEPGR